MKIIVEKNYQELSKRAAAILLEEIHSNPKLVLGLATGSTPVGTYEELIKSYKRGEVDFSKVRTFNLDEYIGLEGTHPNSYRYFMNEKLFNHINISIENTFIPDGRAQDLIDEGRRYDKHIEEIGGIDIQILGIGTNGHIAFNEPARELNVGTSVVDLTESTINDNRRFFSSREVVPKTAVSMGIGSIMKAKKIILLASGRNKAEIMNKLLSSSTISTDMPASFLLLHPDVTIILDKEAND